MPEKPRDYEAELRALMDALAESVVEATDEEIISEMREGGEDPAAAAEGVRAVLRHAVNLGQGVVLQTGIEYALAQGAQHVFTFDADG